MLDSLHIKNFRCFEDLTIPSLGRVNLIVGRNNSGKSTLLEAINLFATAGNPETINEILDKRGDNLSLSKIQNQTTNHTKKIFFDNHSPNSFEKRLEIGSIGKTNLLIIMYFNKETKEALKLYLEGHIEDANIIDPYQHMNTIKILSRKMLKSHDSRSTIPIFKSPTDLVEESLLASMWDHVFLTMDDSILKEALQIIEKDAINIGFVPVTKSHNNDAQEYRTAVIKLKNQSAAVPIKKLGDGMSRILQIFLYALQAKNGFLLIDEFENGLHYSVQEEVLEKLYKLAKELDIQVFVTTHSEDTVKAFSKVALRSPEEGQIIYLARHMREQDPDKGKISAVVYNENDLEMILQTGMEVR